MIISSEKQMLKVANNFGSSLVNNLNQNLIIYLKGELGSGKTTFSKGLIKGMGFQDLIRSPTFSISERIETIEFYILHIDLYRIER